MAWILSFTQRERSHMSQSDKASKRPTIGFLVENLFDFYEEGLRRAIMQEAEAADVNLVCFLGGRAWGQRQGRRVYELVGPESVDGVIAVSACLDLGGSSRDDGLEGLFRGYAPLPVVSFGKAVRGAPSILVENGAGIRDLMDHLIDLHGLQRIAFIRGPAQSDEAEARFAAYRSALERHGLQYDPARVFDGDFSAGSGAEAVRVFLDQRHVELDGIVGANDYMAIDALMALKRRGLKVPGNVAVGGFDDIPNALSSTPSLTTVRQPLRAMARFAMESILAMIQGGAIPPVTSFPTEMVVRHSCGCLAQSEETKEIGDLTSSGGQSEASARRTVLARRLEAQYPWIGDRLRMPSWTEELAGLLSDEFERSAGGRFLPAFEALAARGFEYGMTAIEWQNVVKTLFGAARRLMGNHLLERLGLLRERALLEVGTLAERFQVALNIKVEQEAQILQRIFDVTGGDEEEIWHPLQNELPKIGINSLFLMRHVPQMEGKVSLEFYYSQDDNVVLDAQTALCPAKQLLPGRFTQAHRYGYIVLPIHSGSAQMGYAVCELGSVNGSTFELMGYQIGRALKASHQAKEVEQRVSELEAELEKRTRQLNEALEPLRGIARQAG
jgi:sigma-B regulation protein RsbU (phosphoserine phosphatase)